MKIEPADIRRLALDRCTRHCAAPCESCWLKAALALAGEIKSPIMEEMQGGA